MDYEACLAEAWKRGATALAEGESGEWRVVRSIVSREDEAEARRQAAAFGEDRYTEAGAHVALLRGDDVWMADNRDEMRDHLEVYEQTVKLGGRCLVHGLGLGLITRAMLDLPAVEHVDVVELESDVIRLVAPAFASDIDKGRLTIHRGDCFTKRWVRARWTVVWHDIWQPMVLSNLTQMAELHNLFADRCQWQGSWGREWLEEYREKLKDPPKPVAVLPMLKREYVTRVEARSVAEFLG